VGGERGHVLVTGTSTGIGAATTKLLVDKGFQVFAAVRREADAEAWRETSGGKLTPLTIDVTQERTIAAAADAVADVVGKRGLAGLVNNAGIGKPAPIEFQPLADFRTQLEVSPGSRDLELHPGERSRGVRRGLGLS
jgi:NAD(P)-dependent dehydrogenase (short-subunit alcohol dehydrogenase family)